jgi:hypothetical protein
MNRPEAKGAAEPKATGTDERDAEEADTPSPLDPEVEGPINAAVHFEENDREEGS